MLHGLKRFRRDTSGNVLMMIGLAIPVVFLAIGGAIDFSRVIQLKRELQDAADVASVGSVAVNSYAYKAFLNGSGGSGGGYSEDEDEDADKKDKDKNKKGHGGDTGGGGGGGFKSGEDQAKAIFASNVRDHNDLNDVKVKVKIKKAGDALTSDVSVTANYRPYMLGLMGMTKVPIQVKSTSASTFPPFIDFHLLLDNTPSMGVGATTADIDKMVSLTKSMPSNANCAFACHESGSNSGKDYYSLAKKNGVTMRIDVVRQATQNLMLTAKNTQTLTNQYRMAIYHFGAAADKIDAKNPAPWQVSALTPDLNLSAKNAAAIDLMSIPHQNYNSDRQTNFQSTLLGMNKLIPSSGDGSSSAKPQQVLFFVSDGVNDGYDCAYNNGSTCRRIAPLDTTQCKAMKARGVKIAVLYTTYLPLKKGQNSFYDSHLAKYVTPKSQLAEKMEECASEGLYFEVGPNQGISDAMNALFTKVVSVVRISS